MKSSWIYSSGKIRFFWNNYELELVRKAIIRPCEFCFHSSSLRVRKAFHGGRWFHFRFKSQLEYRFSIQGCDIRSSRHNYHNISNLFLAKWISLNKFGKIIINLIFYCKITLINRYLFFYCRQFRPNLEKSLKLKCFVSKFYDCDYLQLKLILSVNNIFVIIKKYCVILKQFLVNKKWKWNFLGNITISIVPWEEKNEPILLTWETALELFSKRK